MFKTLSNSSNCRKNLSNFDKNLPEFRIFSHRITTLNPGLNSESNTGKNS
jgi:hypothetical protein